MKRVFLGLSAALLVLAPALAHAQRTPPAGSSTVGSASPRGGESSGSSSSSSPSSPSSPSSSGSASVRGGGTSGGSTEWSSPASHAGVRYSGPRSGESTRPIYSYEAAGSTRARISPNVGQPVPASERPRGDRPIYGVAAPRTGGLKPPPERNDGWNGYYYPYYGWSPLYYGSYPYSYYGFYDECYNPFTGFGWRPCFDPMFLGWNFWAAGAYGYYGSAWQNYSAGDATYNQSADGALRLKVKPKEAEVYVDGAFYGHVDDYDGTFKHLQLRVGPHKLEIRAEGYTTLQTDVRILPGKTVTYTGELKPIK